MLAVGHLLAGRYRVDARLGAGGMGSVWRARDLRLDRDVAVKVLMPSLAGDPVLAERFDREARALAAVTSPYVVAIHDVVTSAGADSFLVMELCPDGSLGDRLDAAGSLSVAEALPLLADAAEGLLALHARGILHRDVTPRNVLLSGGRAKLGDLGLARAGAAIGRPPLSDLTATGTTVGTLAYLAPELLEGEPPGVASDIYGLGAVAYRTLAGVLPHSAGSVAELVTTRMRPVAPLGEHAPGVGPALASLVARTLDVRPAARPTAAELAAALRVLAVAAADAAIDIATGTTAADAAADIATRAATNADAPTRPAIATEARELGQPDRSRAATPIPSRPGRGSDRYRGPSLWTGELLLIAIVAAVVVLVLLALAGAFGAGTVTPPG
jgi:serine/threonine-protein kinase